MREFFCIAIQQGANKLRVSDSGTVFVAGPKGYDIQLVGTNKWGGLALDSEYYTLAKSVLIQMGWLVNVAYTNSRGKKCWKQSVRGDLSRDVDAWIRTIDAVAHGQVFPHSDTRRQTWQKKEWNSAAVAYALNFCIDMWSKQEISPLGEVVIEGI